MHHPPSPSRHHSKARAEDVLNEFKTDATTGLSSSAVGALLRHYGANKLESEEQEHIVLRYIGQFKDPLILLLLGSAVLSVIVGQYEDAMSIAVAVLIVGSVAFYQEYQSEKSIEALNDLVPPRCNVVRDGKVVNVLAEDLVPGDVIRLQSGDRVPADARVVQSTSLSVDESSLTGEQEPREKTVAALPDLADDTEISARANMVFMGTLVCSGHALAVVTATALATEFGKTFQEMKDIENRRTPLQIKMDELGKKLSVFSFGIIGCIGALGMFQGKSFMSMFNIGVSLAVAAIPEGLPICVTVTLALGVMRMAQKHAIVKKLPAVEALGCATYICSDKTGTLTENKMTAMRVYCPAMEDAVTLGRAAPPVGASADEADDGLLAGHPGAWPWPWQATYNGRGVEVPQHACLHRLFDAGMHSVHTWPPRPLYPRAESPPHPLLVCLSLCVCDRCPSDAVQQRAVERERRRGAAHGSRAAAGGAPAGGRGPAPDAQADARGGVQLGEQIHGGGCMSGW